MRRLLTTVLLCVAALARAQSFPAKPIHLIVPFPPGGGNDTVARAIAHELGPDLGQPMVIDNRPGAGGSVGAELAAKAPPDGYTLFLAGVGSHAVNPNLHAKLGYDPVKDFAPITLLASAPSVLVVNIRRRACDGREEPISTVHVVTMVLLVNQKSPVASVQDLVNRLKANPGKVTMASPGLGTTNHLAVELFAAMTGTKPLHVPYKGSGPALTELLGGQVETMIDQLTSSIGYIRDGRVKLLAVTGKQRSPAMPNVPTLAESGLPDYQAGSWYGIVAPAGTPREVIDRLHHAIVKALKQPEVAKRLAAEGAVVIGSTPEEFGAHIKAELARVGNVARAAGIHIE